MPFDSGRARFKRDSEYPEHLSADRPQVPSADQKETWDFEQDSYTCLYLFQCPQDCIDGLCDRDELLSFALLSISNIPLY